MRAARSTTATVSAAVRVHNGERYIGDCLRAVLAQTRPADEVIVVDDGSTDDTLAELAYFGAAIRVVSQPNGGVAAALERCFAEARCDYVAICDADDVWAPDKLQRQLAAVAAHPEIDVAVSGARYVGRLEGPRAPYRGEGLLEWGALAQDLYRANFICNSSTLIRRELQRRLGQLERGALCEDYDYWLRALAAGAVFFYDPAMLVSYRAHAAQVSNDLLAIHRGQHEVHRRHASLLDDRRLVRTVLARDLSNIGRALGDLDRPREARAAFLASLRERPTARVLAWVLVLSTPPRCRDPLARRLVTLKRTLLGAPT
jgi:glycosyltransferase involved in cell wall biosynthesis